MRQLLLILFVAAFAVTAKAQTVRENFERDIYFLAADSLYGRIAGTEGSRKASQYIADRFAELGIKPLYESGYFQNFTYSRRLLKARNVVAVVEGTDPQLRDEYIVVGAHYDHIGAISREGGIIVYNGADDNASGVAAMLETARLVKANPLARSVIFAAYDAEEEGLVGSEYMVRADTIYHPKVKLMFSLDMVGGLKYGGKLEYCGYGQIEDGKAIFEVENPDNLPLKIIPGSTKIFSGTDSQSYTNKGIPGVYVNTGLKTPYHKPEDVAEIIDYDGIVLVTNHFYRVLQKAASPAQKLVARIDSDRSDKITFGVTLGVGSNRLYIKDGGLTGKNAFAVNVGFFSRISIYQRGISLLSLKPEIGVERRYARTASSSTLYSDAISIPLNIEYKITGYGYGLTLQAGGYYNYLLGAKQEQRNIIDQLKRNELGLSWGLGIYFGKFDVGCVWRYGLTPFFDANNSKVFNHTALLKIGYRL